MAGLKCNRRRRRRRTVSKYEFCINDFGVEMFFATHEWTFVVGSQCEECGTTSEPEKVVQNFCEIITCCLQVVFSLPKFNCTTLQSLTLGTKTKGSSLLLHLYNSSNDLLEWKPQIKGFLECSSLLCNKGIEFYVESFQRTEVGSALCLS